MFSHIMIGSNDMPKSKSFYDAVIGASGGKPGVEDAKGRVIYAHRGGRLLLTKPIDGKTATGANGGTIGFTMESPDEVEAWHKAGLAHGGQTCEDPPGVRPGGTMFIAYLRDPDGNKLCALHRMAS